MMQMLKCEALLCTDDMPANKSLSEISLSERMCARTRVSACVRVCVREASLPICSLGCGETYAVVGDCAIERDSRTCAQLFEMRASHSFRPSLAQTRRSPKIHHVAVMLFQTSSGPWGAGTQGAKCLFSVNTCSLCSFSFWYQPLPSPTLQPRAPWGQYQCWVSGVGTCPRTGQSEGPTGLSDGNVLRCVQ